MLGRRKKGGWGCRCLNALCVEDIDCIEETGMGGCGL